MLIYAVHWIPTCTDFQDAQINTAKKYVFFNILQSDFFLHILTNPRTRCFPRYTVAEYITSGAESFMGPWTEIYEYSTIHTGQQDLPVAQGFQSPKQNMLEHKVPLSDKKWGCLISSVQARSKDWYRGP